MTSRAVAALAASLLLSGSALAADLIIEEPVVVAPEANSAFWGSMELGVQGVIFTNTDDDDGTAGGYYGSFSLWGDLGGLVLGIDGYADQLFLDYDQGDDVAAGVATLGGHAGGQLGDIYLGGLAAVGLAPDSYADAYNPGYLVGVEAAVALDSVTVFGQLGYADVRLENDGNNEGFTGLFVEGGALFALSDDLAVLAKAGFGYAAIQIHIK